MNHVLELPKIPKRITSPAHYAEFIEITDLGPYSMAGMPFAHYTTALIEEAGELAGVFKKWNRNAQPPAPYESWEEWVGKEAGDITWYSTRIQVLAGVTGSGIQFVRNYASDMPDDTEDYIESKENKDHDMLRRLINVSNCTRRANLAFDASVRGDKDEMIRQAQHAAYRALRVAILCGLDRSEVLRGNIVKLYKRLEEDSIKGHGEIR